VLVDALATDLELDALDEDVAEPVEPPESVDGVAGGGGDGDGWEVDLEIGAMDQVTIAGNGACDLFAKVGRAVESLLNGLEACGSVPAINQLEKCNLGISGQVDILRYCLIFRTNLEYTSRVLVCGQHVIGPRLPSTR
jgi:hypothetical protein